MGASNIAGLLEGVGQVCQRSALGTCIGAGQRERALSQFIASATRIAAGVSIPAFAVLVVSAFKSSGSGRAAWFTLWVVLITLYASGLGATLAALSRGSAWLLPRHGRFLLFCVVLVPEVLRTLAGWPLPSLPSACGSFFELAKSWARGSP